MPVRLSDLRIGQRIKGGASGVIHEVDTPPAIAISVPLVFKQFKDPAEVSGHALDRLTMFRDRATSRDQDFIDQRMTWPVSTVVDEGGRVIGYLMRRVPEEFFVSLRTAVATEYTPCHIDQLFVSDTQLVTLLGSSPTQQHRVAYALALAGIYQFLHRQKPHALVYGDLNWKNALWNPEGDRPAMMLIDCDSVRFTGQGAALAQAHTKGWVPPECELGSPTQTVMTDRYKLSLAIMRILSPGLNLQVQSYRGFEQHRVVDLLDSDCRVLLRRGLGARPDERPSVDEWVTALARRLRSIGPPPHRVTPVRTAAAPPPVASRSKPTGSPTPRAAVPLRPGAGHRRRGTPAPPPPKRPPVRRAGRRVAGAVAAVLVIGGAAWWVAIGADTGGGVPGPTLEAAGILGTNESLVSEDGDYSLRMQTDGNLVLYGPDGAMWSSRTASSDATLRMQTDGNLVLYGGGGEGPLWSSRTGGNDGAFITVQDDGNVVMYSPTAAGPLWSTGTSER